ncbi:MAG TPA: hypothetical protein VGO07_01010, partial [Candidatus Saccharimonadales bacterium]|nr:hypothetical protein [Candidatus Saccharimonadales bacterium]
VNDFKTITSYRLTGVDQFDIVNPGGEIKHGTLGSESYTNKADTYGKMLSIDRRDIINDDLGALQNVPQKLGRGAGLKLNDVFWTEFLNNSTFFTTGNLNYATGASTVLGIDALTTFEILFFNQVDAQGKPLGTMAETLLVPTALKTTADVLMKSTEVRNASQSTKEGTANPHTGKYKTVMSRYLQNAAYTGYSATAWYLLGNPGAVPVIETCFLNGNESPIVEQAQADFDTLGIKMRGYYDFGCKQQDYRGGVKSKGAA